VLSGIEPPELVRAVRQSDLARLVRIPGIGRKTAERLVLELRDKLPAPAAEEAPAEASDAGLRDDLLSALANLGYQRGAVEKTVDRVLRDAATHDFDPLLRAVLKDLTR
jgi:Holliday junction DNA helicase RuvA